MSRLPIALAVALLAAPAIAQQELPRLSPAERLVGEINRDLARERRIQGALRQNEFEANALRQEIIRQRAMPRLEPPQIVVPAR